MNTIKETIEIYEKNPKGVNMVHELEKDIGPTVQLLVQENRGRPGHHIFIREDGKIGFATLNSIDFSIGDITRGKIIQEQVRYFMVEIQEIVEPNSSN